MLLLDERVKGGRSGIRALAPRIEFEFQPTLVVFIQWFPKLLGVGGVDENRDAQFSTFGPNGIDAWIVNVDVIALGVFF